MKIIILSDTHGYHNQIEKEESDIVIHCGDSTNYKDWIRNEFEWFQFVEWFNEYPAKHKIYVPGNHDTYIENFSFEKDSDKYNFTVLLHEYIEVEGISIFGSPFVPMYNHWAFERSENKLARYWQDIPHELDILVTHTPPKSILDLAPRDNNLVEMCGSSSLYKRVMRVKPQYHLFGHIHDNKKFSNNGILYRDDITFINCSQVRDNDFDKGIINKPKIINL